jgi:hypothetical protein
MARYFHIKDGADLIKDQEGTEPATPDAARVQALRSARELWADAIKSGKPLGADAIVISDEQGGDDDLCAYERRPAEAPWQSIANHELLLCWTDQQAPALPRFYVPDAKPR